MSKTSNGEPFSIKGAVQTIQKLEGLEIGLYYRTEGMTSMLWGLVVGGIFFTYQSMGPLFADGFPWWGSFLWAPWVAAGFAATGSLWRSVHLSAASGYPVKEGVKTGLVYLALFMGVMFLGFAFFGIFQGRVTIKEPAYMTALLGVASILMGILPKPQSSPICRRVNVIVGLLALAAVVVLAFTPHGTDGGAYLAETLVGAVILGGGWFASGLYLASKG